jgi:hypothetical protein
MSSSFLPVTRMIERAHLARDESDTAYFFELLYLGEMVIKPLVVEVLAGLQDDRERHRYALEYRLVRADSLGQWADVLDEALTGPASQQLLVQARDSQRTITASFGPAEDTWQRHAVDLLNGAGRSIDSQVEDTARQKVSLRQWVRQFVWLRNRTRGHGAPKSATLSTVCSALRSSLDEVVTNAPAFQRPWAHLRRNLSRKYRVSGFGGDREPFSFLTHETEHTLPDGAYVFIDRPRRADLLFTDPDLTDFFFPNGNFRSQSFEVLSYITDERGTEDGSHYVLPLGAQPASETAAAPSLDVVGEVFTNMPPRRHGYVSRTALELELAQLLQDERHPVITLQGRGGVGKTSLALEVLHQVARQGDFSAIIWFSARDIDLLSEGPKIVRPDVLSVEDVARDFERLMQPGVPSKLALVHRYFTDCLSGQAPDGPFIFVLDNFETIREPAELFSYLSNAVRLPNKVLITTRTRDFKGDYPIEVRGMARDEYGKLVNEVSGHLGIGHVIDEEYEEELFEESDGHPYITKVLLGEIAHEGHRLSLKRVVAAHEAMLDALFDRSFATLSPAGQRVFLTMCGWRSLIPRVGLEAVLLRPGNERLDIERALSELEQLSLVEVLDEPESTATFLSVPLAAAVFGKRKLVTSPLKVAVDADLELIRGFGVATTTDLAQGLKPRIERVIRAAARRASEGADISQELSVIEYIGSEYAPAWLSLATLRQETGDIVAAIHATNRYLESRPDDEDGWRRLIGLYRVVGDPLAEMHARLQLVELGRPPFHELSASANLLNGLLSRKEIELDADERRLMVHKLRSLMEERHAEADATDLSRLAWLCMHDQDRPAAERWAGEGLKREPENQYCKGLLDKIADK